MDESKRCRGRQRCLSVNDVVLTFTWHTTGRTSSKKTRLQGYLVTAGNIGTCPASDAFQRHSYRALIKFLELTQEDIDSIDAAGAIGEKQE